MLRINKENFYQGVRQVAFFHCILSKDSWYDIEKDVVNGELMLIGEGVDHAMDDQQTDAA